MLKLQRISKHSTASKLLREYDLYAIVIVSFGSYGRMWMTPQFFDRLVAAAIVPSFIVSTG